MSEAYTILVPLPQLKLRDDLPAYNLGDDLSIRPLGPQLRGHLLNVANEQKWSDDRLILLTESDSVFCAQIPARKTKADNSIIAAFIYAMIAEEILKRIFRCLLLFQWVPAPLFHHCWFWVTGSADDINNSSLKIINPNWQYIDLFTNIDWRSGNVEPIDISLGLIGLQSYWNKLSEICQIEQLKIIFTSVEKEKGVFASANKYVKHKVEELMKAKYGPEVYIEDGKIDATTGMQHLLIMRKFDRGDGESDATAEMKSNGNTLPKTTISTKMWSRWFSQALDQAYSREVDKLSQELHKRVMEKRFDRAFQLFSGAFRVAEPYSFIGFATCLESLFCTSRNEITFQLASRVAWFLHPDDYNERITNFDKVKSLYGLRSEIVHGTKYSPSIIESSEGELIDFSREAFQKILSDDRIYNTFRHKDQNVCNAYLDGLNLGSQ